MPIELTDKITPKNAAFADIVDAKNVGGDGTSSNALQADAVASPAALEIVRIDSTNSFLEGIATVPVGSGGTGATTLTGYVKGSGTSALTASATIPGTDVSGNISGNAANVTGTVAVGNGGTGATTLTGYVKGSGTSALTASATIPGTDVSGNISGSAANVTGTVAVANGGTGQTTANAALNALLPSQTSNSGKFLQTDGTNTSWAAGAGGSMVYPGAGIANSTGSAWGTSYSTTGSGTVVALATSPTLTTPNIGAATGTSLTLSSLTSGRVALVGASGLLTDSADLQWSGTALSLAATYRFYLGGATSGVNTRQNLAGAMVFATGVSDWASLSSTAFAPTTAGSHSLGTSSLGWNALYLDESGAGTETVAVVAPTLTGNVTVTMPTFNTTLGGRVASYDGTALTGVASNQLLASAAAGFYRISVFMICTRAATGGGAASTLGANTRVTYTPIGATGPITHYIPMFIYGSALNLEATGTTVNFVDTVLAGSVVMYVASTAVVTYSNDYTSTGTGTSMMRYNVSVRLERID